MSLLISKQKILSVSLSILSTLIVFEKGLFNKGILLENLSDLNDAK